MGRNWTRKSIEEVVTDYLHTLNIEQLQYSATTFCLDGTNGNIWLVLVSSNSETIKPKNVGLSNIFPNNLSGTFTISDQLETYNIPVAIQPLRTTEYFATTSSESLRSSNFGTSTDPAKRLVAGCQKLLFNRGVNSFGTDTQLIRTAWQVLDNEIVVYQWVPNTADDYLSNMRIGPDAWCNWSDEHTSQNVSTTYQSTATIKWTTISLYSYNFINQTVLLANTIEVQGLSDIDINLTTFTITVEQLHTIYNKPVRVVTYTH